MIKKSNVKRWRLHETRVIDEERKKNIAIRKQPAKEEIDIEKFFFICPGDNELWFDEFFVLVNMFHVGSTICGFQRVFFLILFFLSAMSLAEVGRQRKESIENIYSNKCTYIEYTMRQIACNCSTYEKKSGFKVGKKIRACEESIKSDHKLSSLIKFSTFVISHTPNSFWFLATALIWHVRFHYKRIV